MQRYKILWADDEIDLLKPHILFLNEKGYDVTPVNNGLEAVERVADEKFDIVFLDENMPGMTGIEALGKIKSKLPTLPIVMITKSEEEHIMEEAIGSKISDYLIKPLNPNQILLSVKKLLDNKRLVSEKTNLNYQQDFTNISMTYNDIIDYKEWADVYKKLIFWELEIDNTEYKSMKEVIDMQKKEANSNFTKFISDNYEDWLSGEYESPLLSPDIMKERVFPECTGEPVFFMLIDNLRFDQWKVLEPIISEYFDVVEEDTYYSILPTTTAYARNSIFSGMYPDEMAGKHPDLWSHDDEEGGKNLNEKKFLKIQIDNERLDLKFSYHKIVNVEQGKDLVSNVNNLLNNDLNVVVYNFVDMLSHARTDMEVIKELASDEAAYRSLTKSWFEHSPLHEFLQKIAKHKVKLIITTDHGTIRVEKPVKIAGDKNTNKNLRYKQGKSLGYDKKQVLEAYKPERFRLPKRNVSTGFVFCTEGDFFAYPNNYNYYVNFYKDTFQHGGVSLEEMIIPIVKLTPRK